MRRQGQSATFVEDSSSSFLIRTVRIFLFGVVFIRECDGFVLFYSVLCFREEGFIGWNLGGCCPFLFRFGMECWNRDICGVSVGGVVEGLQRFPCESNHEAGIR